MCVADGGGSGGSGGTTVTATDGKVTVDARTTSASTSRRSTRPRAISRSRCVEKGSLDHTLVVEDADGHKVGGQLAVSGGETGTGTYPSKPATYVFFCDIPGHRGQGMEGTIVVK